jgi:hypothetical protein
MMLYSHKSEYMKFDNLESNTLLPCVNFGIMVCIAVLILPLMATAQVGSTGGQAGVYYLSDLKGNPVGVSANERFVSGSIFWKDYWNIARLEEKDGLLYLDVPIKLNLLEHRIYFIDKQGITRELFAPLKRIELKDSLSGKTVVFAEYAGLGKTKGASGKWWVEVVAEGKVTLLCEHVKRRVEDKPYGSATIEVSINNATNWYVVQDGQLQPFKRIKELQALLATVCAGAASYKPKAADAAGQYAELVQYCNAR